MGDRGVPRVGLTGSDSQLTADPGRADQEWATPIELGYWRGRNALTPAAATKEAVGGNNVALFNVNGASRSG
jgi:hypothetical protein